MSAPLPFMSVVVPVHRGEQVLRRSLSALQASTLPRSEWELIVVDDASPDATAAAAAEYADAVVRLDGGPRGPAYARNRGVEAGRGQVVVFIDADVCVHTETLELIADGFRRDGGLAALFGSYDSKPAAPGLVSRFRNLLHHHTHQSNPGPAETFWAGCGAVRRTALIDVGLMDAWHFPRPQIEDIELGRRLRRAGYRIELRPDIQCTHLKHWTLRSMVVTDFRDRGIPWMRLLLCEGSSGAPATLNLKRTEKLCTLLAGMSGISLLAAIGLASPVLLGITASLILAIVALNHRFYRVLARTGGFPFAVGAVPVHLIFYLTGGAGAVAGMVLFYMRGVPQPTKRVADEAASSWPPPRDCPPLSIWMLARSRSPQ